MENNPLKIQQEVKMKAWALQYWPKTVQIGQLNPNSSRLMLLPAFTHEDAIVAAEEGAFPILGLKKEDWFLTKAISVEYDQLFPGLAKIPEEKLEIGKMNEMIEYRGYQKSEVDAMINHFEEDGVNRFIVGLRLMLDRVDPTKSEKAAVERLITKTELKYAEKPNRAADEGDPGSTKRY